MQDYIEAHAFSSNHRKELLKDYKCGCFSCLATFHPKEIVEWIDENNNTAICPYCGIDSIIGGYSGHPITK